MTISFSLPKWSRVQRVFWRISDWIDDNWFPICDVVDPMPKGLAERQALIERSANNIREAIAGCRTLAQCYRCVDMVRNFQLLHGEIPNSKNQIPSCDAQVTGWVASLGLDLKNKQEEILSKI